MVAEMIHPNNIDALQMVNIAMSWVILYTKH